ncbi:MAG: peptidoglycan binding protein CsiV [Gammaproteobacteria bacterium]|nr:peptidoglycan binding protein CsiV [Gammaproteobacteria bacterium]
MNNIIRLFVLLFGISLIGAAHAQDNSDDWYDVEVIVFERLNPQDYAPEKWPQGPGFPDLNGADEITAAETSPHRLLPRERYRLNNEYDKIAKSKNIRPLIHIAWRQLVPNRERGDRVHLHSFSGSGKTTSNRQATPLDGVISIGKGRYLHIDSDLVLHRNNSGSTGTPEFIRMKGDLRMRSNELHYLDHPMGGMLIQFTPVKAKAGT